MAVVSMGYKTGHKDRVQGGRGNTAAAARIQACRQHGRAGARIQRRGAALLVATCV